MNIFTLMAGAMDAVGIGPGKGLADSMIRSMAGIPITPSMFDFDDEDGMDIAEAKPVVTERVIRDVERAEDLPIQGSYTLTPEELQAERNASLSRLPQMVAQQNVRIENELSSGLLEYDHRGRRRETKVNKNTEEVNRESTQVADMQMVACEICGKFKCDHLSPQVIAKKSIEPNPCSEVPLSGYQPAEIPRMEAAQQEQTALRDAMYGAGVPQQALVDRAREQQQYYGAQTEATRQRADRWRRQNGFASLEPTNGPIASQVPTQRDVWNPSAPLLPPQMTEQEMQQFLDGLPLFPNEPTPTDEAYPEDAPF